MAFWRANKADRDRKEGDRSPGLEVERLIEKGRLKDAVKQAKLRHRDDPSPEHHRLLERAYLLRARQLLEGGMASAAQEVALHLVEFGVTDPGLIGPSAELLAGVGLADRALALQARLADEDPEAAGRLLRRAADQAVLHPGRSTGAPPEIRSGAARVREALDAVRRGDEEAARSALKDITRGSPLGEWKRFALGLIAFRGRDDERCRDAWDRLDPDRAPGRIAKGLRSLDLPGADLDAPGLEPIERRALGEPVLGPLRALGSMVAQDRWAEATRILSSIRPALRRIDPKLGERLTRILSLPLIKAVSRLGYAEAQRTIRAFIAGADPLPIDPRWNRLWALIWEGPQGHIDEAEPFWRKYLKDLETAPGLRDEERPTARAIVLTHLGRELAEEASAMDDTPLSGFSRIDAEARRERKRAVDCLEEALRLCPTHRPAYQALIDAHRAWGQPEEAAEVGRLLLDALPDDFDTLMDLAAHHYRRDDPGMALEYAGRARALRPLDDEAIGQEWSARVSLARHHALKRRFDEARAEFDLAERLRPESARSLHLLARKAVLELKAGRDDRARWLIAEAEGLLAEPSPLWLALLIEARRYKLPKKTREPFERSWADALSKKRRSETAGALAELLSPFLAGDVPYTGRDTHARQVADYLRRTTRLKYRREDLASACSFLGLIPRERKLFETLAAKGSRNFPDAPEFPMMLGAFEMEKGPFRADLPKARRLLEKGLHLAEAQAPADPRAAAMVPKLRETLTSLEDLAALPMHSPFGAFPFGGPGSPLPDPSSLPPHVLDMIETIAGQAGIDPEDLFGDEDEYDDDDFGDLFGDEDEGPPLPPGPRPRPPASKPRKKKRER